MTKLVELLIISAIAIILFSSPLRLVKRFKANKESKLAPENTLTPGFVYLKNIVPDIKLDIRYATSNNFTGSTVPGYKRPIAILTQEAANSLKAIYKHIQTKEMKKAIGFSKPTLLIWDAYRPQRACDSFKAWALNGDHSTKSRYYPNTAKQDLFKLGYIAERSTHSRGSTVDLTIIDAKTGKMLDMGSPFDLFDSISHPDSKKVTEQQFKNRQLLKSIMEKHGWRALSTEWWHFTLEGEPFPDTYFHFSVR